MLIMIIIYNNWTDTRNIYVIENFSQYNGISSDRFQVVADKV